MPTLFFKANWEEIKILPNRSRKDCEGPVSNRIAKTTTLSMEGTEQNYEERLISPLRHPTL